MDKNKDKIYENHRLYLQESLGKFMMTSLIGTIEIFEKSFGELWGHGKDEADLNDDEFYWREVWEFARTQLLDKGHKQQDKAKRAIEEYDLEPRTRHYNIFKNGRGNGKF